MLRNYLKTAWRSLIGNRIYSLINIAGLAVVLAVSVLLFWWVKDELSYDRFHADADRIYRILAHFGQGVDENTWTGTPAPIAVAASKDVPGVEAVVRVRSLYDFRTYKIGGRTFTEKSEAQAFVDENFLDVFSGFTLRAGNPKAPFPTPNSVVMTEEMALKFFGTSDALGRTLVVADSSRVFIVGAVLNDLPDNSSLKYKLYFPMSLAKRTFGGNGEWKRMDDDWGNYYFETFLKIAPNADWTQVGPKLTAIQAVARGKDAAGSDYRLQPLSQIHLYQPDGKDTGMRQVRMLGLVAVLLLFIGCVNYVNLTTARATRRAREVGVRKVVGAESKQLFGQLLTESLLTMALSLAIALLLIQGLLPFYGELTGKTTGFSLLDADVWMVLLGTLTCTVLLAGMYPALMISSFDPIRSLRGRSGQAGQAGLRRVLVVTQFALATGLIIGTMVIGGQLQFMREKDLGFDKEHTFVLGIGRDEAERFCQELQKVSSVRAVVTASNGLLGGGGSTGDTDWDGKAPGRSFIVQQMGVSPDFIPAYGISIAAGKNFTGTKADSTSFILNETAVKEAGIIDPVGKRFKFHETEGRIIGVVRDFNTQSIRQAVEPMLLYSNRRFYGQVHVKTTGADAAEAIAAAERIWKEVKPDEPFEYSFLDQTYDRMYRAEQRTGKLFNFFAGVAILVSCLGLFGLAAFTAEQRTKEIGVRKVLGASVTGIVALLSRDFLKLVLAGIAIASPLAWWMMNDWLADFAYRIAIEWWVFALAGGLAVGIALLTVSFQSIKAALMNPIKSLRTE